MPPPFGCRQSVDKRSAQRYGTGTKLNQSKYYKFQSKRSLYCCKKQTNLETLESLLDVNF